MLDYRCRGLPHDGFMRIPLHHRANLRPIWQGASALKTQERAFLEAYVSFYDECAAAFQNEHPHEPLPDGYLEKRLETKVAEGDQLALLVKGWDLCSAKKYDEATVTLRRATEAKPGNFAHLAHFALARAIEKKILAELEKRSGNVKEFERTLEPLKVAKDLKPDFAPTVLWLANTYDKLDDVGDKTPELLLEANDLVRLMPRCYEAYQLRGAAWAKLGRPEAFERDFEKANQLRPNDPMLHWKKASCYGKLNNDRRVVETYKEAIQLDADCKYSPVLYYSLAMTYQRLGDCSAEAIAAYEKATAFGGEVSFKYQIAQCRNQLDGRP